MSWEINSVRQLKCLECNNVGTITESSDDWGRHETSLRGFSELYLQACPPGPNTESVRRAEPAGIGGTPRRGKRLRASAVRAFPPTQELEAVPLPASRKRLCFLGLPEPSELFD
jgi:hypothetical protein